jgi:hypothetical protein
MMLDEEEEEEERGDGYGDGGTTDRGGMLE